MDSLPGPIREEYERWQNIIQEYDDPAGKDVLRVADVLRAHFLIAGEFYNQKEGLGGLGPHSVDLLFSAVHRQHTRYGSAEKWKSDLERCATIIFGIVKDHPFHDANKRTALLSALYHLEKIHRCPAAQQRDFENLFVDVADDALGKYPPFAHFHKQFGPDAEVYFIADFLRANTRPIDTSVRSITYRDLNTILTRYGYSLENPNKNHIDVVRWDTEQPLFGFIGKTRRVPRTLGNVGFPGWKSQVSRGDLKAIRLRTRTDGKHGIDAASFFKGIDSMPVLIQSYWGPLRRLANR